MTAAPQQRAPLWLMYVFVGAAVVALLIWAMRAALAEVPSRDAAADLGPYGLVTIRLSTNPNPPLPTGTVALSFMPMDSKQRPVALDGLSFEYGREGSDQAVGAGRAELMSDGSGMFMGGAQFPQVGNWWVRAIASKGGAQAAARFTLYVKPAQ